MSIKKELIGKICEKKVYSFKLDNEQGLSAEILNYGGIIKSLVYKGVDVVLGRDELCEYQNNSEYFGAIIGRNANRIENAEFTLDGIKYNLEKNDGKNNLHSADCGFSSKVWEAEGINGKEPKLVLRLLSPDGEGGFPGNLEVCVVYEITRENSLKIQYSAISDKNTICNMTNHSYFNLNGHDSGTISGHKLWVDSNFYLPNNAENIPTGEILSSCGTPFMFNGKNSLESAMKSQNAQIKLCGGFDHSLVLPGNGKTISAKLVGNKSKIEMIMYTDRPCVQLYTTNTISQGRAYKNGANYHKHCALCLETQAFPNNLKYSHFPNSILKKGKQFETTTEYKFI